jgi:hypothetical protein
MIGPGREAFCLHFPPSSCSSTLLALFPEDSTSCTSDLFLAAAGLVLAAAPAPASSSLLSDPLVVLLVLSESLSDV